MTDLKFSLFILLHNFIIYVCIVHFFSMFVNTVKKTSNKFFGLPDLLVSSIKSRNIFEIASYLKENLNGKRCLWLLGDRLSTSSVLFYHHKQKHVREVNLTDYISHKPQVYTETISYACLDVKTTLKIITSR